MSSSRAIVWCSRRISTPPSPAHRSGVRSCHHRGTEERGHHYPTLCWMVSATSSSFKPEAIASYTACVIHTRVSPFSWAVHWRDSLELPRPRPICVEAQARRQPRSDRRGTGESATATATGSDPIPSEPWPWPWPLPVPPCPDLWHPGGCLFSSHQKGETRVTCSLEATAP